MRPKKRPFVRKVPISEATSEITDIRHANKKTEYLCTSRSTGKKTWENQRNFKRKHHVRIEFEKLLKLNPMFETTKQRNRVYKRNLQKKKFETFSQILKNSLAASSPSTSGNSSMQPTTSESSPMKPTIFENSPMKPTTSAASTADYISFGPQVLSSEYSNISVADATSDAVLPYVQITGLPAMYAAMYTSSISNIQEATAPASFHNDESSSSSSRLIIATPAQSPSTPAVSSSTPLWSQNYPGFPVKEVCPPRSPTPAASYVPSTSLDERPLNPLWVQDYADIVNEACEVTPDWLQDYLNITDALTAQGIGLASTPPAASDNDVPRNFKPAHMIPEVLPANPQDDQPTSLSILRNSALFQRNYLNSPALPVSSPSAGKVPVKPFTPPRAAPYKPNCYRAAQWVQSNPDKVVPSTYTHTISEILPANPQDDQPTSLSILRNSALFQRNYPDSPALPVSPPSTGKFPVKPFTPPQATPYKPNSYRAAQWVQSNPDKVVPSTSQTAAMISTSPLPLVWSPLPVPSTFQTAAMNVTLPPPPAWSLLPVLSTFQPISGSTSRPISISSSSSGRNSVSPSILSIPDKDTNSYRAFQWFKYDPDKVVPSTSQTAAMDLNTPPPLVWSPLPKPSTSQTAAMNFTSPPPPAWSLLPVLSTSQTAAMDLNTPPPLVWSPLIKPSTFQPISGSTSRPISISSSSSGRNSVSPIIWTIPDEDTESVSSDSSCKIIEPSVPFKQEYNPFSEITVFPIKNEGSVVRKRQLNVPGTSSLSDIKPVISFIESQSMPPLPTLHIIPSVLSEYRQWKLLKILRVINQEPREFVVSLQDGTVRTIPAKIAEELWRAEVLSFLYNNQNKD